MLISEICGSRTIVLKENYLTTLKLILTLTQTLNLIVVAVFLGILNFAYYGDSISIYSLIEAAA